MIQYRNLEQSDIDGFICIDRSDYSNVWCKMKNGILVHEKREFKHPGFSKSWWDRILKEWSSGLLGGRTVLIGAYDSEIPVGVAGLDVSQRYGQDNKMYNFGPMWISKDYRGRGIGKQLFMMIQKKAEELNIRALYISATPVPRTVRFYMKMGCQILSIPDPHLFAEEPEDIHMYLNLPNRQK